MRPATSFDVVGDCLSKHPHFDVHSIPIRRSDVLVQDDIGAPVTLDTVPQVAAGAGNPALAGEFNDYDAVLVFADQFPADFFEGDTGRLKVTHRKPQQNYRTPE